MSIRDGRAEIRHLERSRSLFVTFDSLKHPCLTVRRCDFEGGRVVTSADTCRIFSGPPPQSWDIRLSLPLNCQEPGEIGDALTTLAGYCGDKVKLQYSAITATRLVTGTVLSPCSRPLSVWALTGHIMTPRGRVVPIGCSGRGSGLACLQDHLMGETLAWKVETINRAKSVDSGALPVVLAPPAAAVILHETIGHFAEASAEKGVDLQHRIGCRIASELFSLHDDPLAPDGCAHYEFDDENVARLGPVEIVRAGILVAQLHSLESARFAGATPTANGRAASAWDMPIPRISNLVCAPGTASEGELLENVGTGLYIHQLADGFSLGAYVEARIVLAEWIRRGKRTGRFLAGGQVKERLDLLTRAIEVGNRPVFSANAMCGKARQILFDVGTCAPAIRFSALRVVA